MRELADTVEIASLYKEMLRRTWVVCGRRREWRSSGVGLEGCTM